MHPYNKENCEKTFLVHLLVQIINYKKMHGEYKVKFLTTYFFLPLLGRDVLSTFPETHSIYVIL